MSQRDDLDALKRRLGARVLDLAVELFGQPTSPTRRELRWGRKGSLSIRLDGKRGPLFYSFESEAGGSLLDAIMFRLDCPFPQAVEWARRWLGDDDERPAPLPEQNNAAAFDARREEAERIASAQRLWRASRPAHGTAAARYLAGRAIDRFPPEAVRFIGASDLRRELSWWRYQWGAMIVPATDAAGTVRAVQLVAIKDNGEPVRDDDGKKIKRTRGAKPETAVRFPGDADGPLLLCEGPETALAAWMATRHATWANLGTIAKAPLDGEPLGRLIVVCRDDDPRNALSRKPLREAIKRWRAEGRRVVETMPWRLSRSDKSDFADTLVDGGVDAVRERIEAATSRRELPASEPLLKARQHLAGAIDRAVRELTAWRRPAPGEPSSRTLADMADAADIEAPFHVVKASLGLGKSEEALRAIAGAIAAGHTAVYLAPTHKLASELLPRAEKILADKGIDAKVRIWRGRERENPNRPGETMCVDLPAIEAVRQAGLKPGETVCKVCPYRDSCAYLAQHEAKGDLWIAPTALLFSERPRTMRGASLAVIDEKFSLDGLTGIGPAPSLLSLDDLDASPIHRTGKDAATADLVAELMPLRRMLRAAVEEHPDGGLDRARLLGVGLTADLARAARKLEYQRRVTVEAKGLTRAGMMAALKRATGNRAVDRAAMMWKHVANLLDDPTAKASGRAALGDYTDKDSGATFRAIRLYDAKERGKGWREIPALHLDATADMDLVRARVPRAELVADVIAATPHVHVRQIVGKTFGKWELEHNEPSRRAAWRFAVVTATRAGGRWLVVTHKAAEEAIRAQFPIPGFMALAHFGDVAGRDEWGDVTGLIVLGRPLPRPEAVETIAGVISGRAVEPAGDWYPAEAVTLHARDGQVRTVEADRHPDALVEATRRAICEGELLQVIGRGRGVNRTEANPLAVIVLGNVPLPVEADELADWQAPTFDDETLADHGAVLASSADAASLAGVTTKAVENRRARENYPRAPIRDSYTSAGVVSARYRRAGSRGPGGRLIYDPRRIPDPRAWLTGKLGELSAFEATDGPPPPETPRPENEPEQATEAGIAGTESHQAPSSGPEQAGIADLPGQFPAQYARAREGVSDPSPPPPFMAPENSRSGPDFTLDGLPATGPVPNYATSTRARARPRPADPGAVYAGGVLPRELADDVRAKLRASGLRQDEFATLVGISRPQIANALAGRFGLSPDVAARLVAVVEALPERQGAFL